MMPLKPGEKQIAITVTDRVYSRVADMAKKAGMSPTAYAGALFNAAYAARSSDTGDQSLDDAVSRVVVLWGTRQFDTRYIAGCVGLHEATVCDIIKGWKAEVLGRAA